MTNKIPEVLFFHSHSFLSMAVESPHLYYYDEFTSTLKFLTYLFFAAHLAS